MIVGADLSALMDIQVATDLQVGHAGDVAGYTTLVADLFVS